MPDLVNAVHPPRDLDRNQTVQHRLRDIEAVRDAANAQLTALAERGSLLDEENTAEVCAAHGHAHVAGWRAPAPRRSDPRHATLTRTTPMITPMAAAPADRQRARIASLIPLLEAVGISPADFGDVDGLCTAAQAR